MVTGSIQKKSILVDLPMDASIEEASGELIVNFYENVGNVRVIVTSSTGEVIYNEMVQTSTMPSLVIPLKDQEKGVLQITDGYNNVYGFLFLQILLIKILIINNSYYEKIIKIMFSLSVLLLMSCVEEIDYSLPRNEVSRNITTVSSDTITNHELLEEFSKALAYSLDSSIELRRIIKNEALKMFDYDYDVLYLSINSYRLTSGKTVDELMSLYMDITRLEKIKQLFSTLTIFVPELPDNSFSC